MASLWHFSTTRSIFLHKVRHKQILATNHRLVHCTTTSASELTQSSATLRSHDKQGCPLVCTQKLTSNAFLVLSDSRSSLLSILKFIALAKSVAPLPTSILAEAFSSTHLATDIGFGYLHVSYTGQMSYRMSFCLHSLNRPFQSSDSTKATVTTSHHCCVKLDQAFAVWIASSPNVVRASTWVIFNICKTCHNYIYISKGETCMHARPLVSRDHLSIMTTWSCPNSACTIDSDLCKVTTSLLSPLFAAQRWSL